MTRETIAISRDEFLWLLGSLCNIHRLPFDAKLVLNQFPPPYGRASLCEAAARLGFEFSEPAAGRAAIPKLPTPFVMFALQPNDDAAAQDSQEPRTRRSALVVKADADRVLYFPAGSQQPRTESMDEFLAIYGAGALVFLPKVQAAKDKDIQARQEPFGFRWFIPELLKHRRIWRDVLLASLAMQLISLATPLCTQAIIDKVVVHQTVSTLAVIAFALFIFIFFTAALSWTRQYLVLHTGNRVDAVLAAAVFERLLKLPARYFEHRPTGVLAARINGVETIREFISGAAVTLVLDLPFLVIFLAIMLYYSVVLTLITMAIIVCIMALSAFVAPLFREKLNQQFLLGARNQAFMTEYVAGMETVKSLQMEPQLIGRYSDYFAAYLEANFRTKQLANGYNVVANALEQLMSITILCLGAWQVMTRPDFTIGMLVAFQMFASRVSQPLLRMVGLWQQFQQAQISVKRVGDIMDAPVEPYSVVPHTQGEAKGEIEFRGVSFRYGEELPYLYRGLSLSIAAGQCIALMGPSGSGKSTLAKLLQGFYLPTEGQVLIDGKDHRFLSANELRAYFGVVPQETILFSGTIYDNLILANPQATFDHVVQACRFAEIHDFIEKLPKGYQTEIGERGVGLSGGQKQRLAIARALLKRPPVLIFDEATSNLDVETAEHFAKTINGLRRKVTLVFISHQLPRGLAVDRVFHLSEGALREGVAARSPAATES
jgi:subfamily B ATP-binding cassette protein HlyB/CyaB